MPTWSRVCPCALLDGHDVRESYGELSPLESEGEITLAGVDDHTGNEDFSALVRPGSDRHGDNSSFVIEEDQPRVIVQAIGRAGGLQWSTNSRNSSWVGVQTGVMELRNSGKYNAVLSGSPVVSMLRESVSGRGSRSRISALRSRTWLLRGARMMPPKGLGTLASSGKTAILTSSESKEKRESHR